MLLMSICGVWTASTLIMMVKGVIDCGWRVDSQICCLLEKLRRSIQIVIGMSWLRPELKRLQIEALRLGRGVCCVLHAMTRPKYQEEHARHSLSSTST